MRKLRRVSNETDLGTINWNLPEIFSIFGASLHWAKFYTTPFLFLSVVNYWRDTRFTSRQRRCRKIRRRSILSLFITACKTNEESPSTPCAFCYLEVYGYVGRRMQPRVAEGGEQLLRFHLHWMQEQSLHLTQWPCQYNAIVKWTSSSSCWSHQLEAFFFKM